MARAQSRPGFPATSSSPPPSGGGQAAVVQASFPSGRIPAKLVVQRAAISQRGGMHTALPPHPATVGRLAAHVQWPAGARPPAQRTAATPNPGNGGNVQVFQPPAGFLANSGHHGQPLPQQLRRDMESFFATDFSDVRVHVGREASSIGAIAFTIGSDIYFAPGQYEPHSSRGRELLGHELTHVVQQRDGRVANPYGEGVAVVQDAELEAEADRLGTAAAQAAGGKVPAKNAPGALQRKALPPHPAKPQTRIDAPPPRSASIQNRAGGFKLLLGAYMHDDKQLPEPLAGHTFVALEDPRGQRQAWGFSPANLGQYDPQRDLGRLTQGVEGVVHDDTTAIAKPGVKLREYRISEAQAQAAMAKVDEYRTAHYPFSLRQRQCSTFALDVLHAAHVDDLGDRAVWQPRDMYRRLDRK